MLPQKVISKENAVSMGITLHLSYTHFFLHILSCLYILELHLSPWRIVYSFVCCVGFLEIYCAMLEDVRRGAFHDLF